MRCRERNSAIKGPLGSGKTFGVIQRILIQMTEQPANANGCRPTRWLAVRNTYPDLFGTTIKDFMAVFGEYGYFKGSTVEPPTFHAAFGLPDGTFVESETVFLALDRDDAVRKIRGYQLTGVWYNEMKELVKPVIDMLDARHGRYPTPIDGGVECGWHGTVGDTNAPDEDHWYYRMAEEVRPEGWAFYNQPPGVLRGEKEGEYLPNPDAENISNLPAGYYTNLVRGKAEDWIHVNVLNEYGFTIDGKPVHPEYTDSVHCSKEMIEPLPGVALTVGADFGRTPAATVWQFDDSMGRWLGLDEFCTEDMSAAIFGPELKLFLDRNYPGFAVQGFGDPAGDSSGQTVESTPIQLLNAAGIPMVAAPSNIQVLRRAAMAGPMRRNCMDGKPAFLISPKMKVTRKGLMGGFCYRRLKIANDDRYTDQPDKNIYSHPCESGEYALLGGGEGKAALRRPDSYRRKRTRKTAIM